MDQHIHSSNPLWKHRLSNAEPSVFDESGKVIYSNDTFTPYLVRVSIEDLNIRKGPGTDYDKTGKYTGKGAFTIVEEAFFQTNHTSEKEQDQYHLSPHVFLSLY
mgnify:CR=1 FL=1